MVSDGRIYKIVPRKGTKMHHSQSLYQLDILFIKLFPVRGRREPEGSIFFVQNSIIKKSNILIEESF